jgi:pimeloyl-ACP methyl ester carboxylesterase
MRRTSGFALLSVLIVAIVASSAAAASAAVTTYKGKFPDGATYLIQVPSNWNGALVLYSHGYVIPGFNNPAEDVGDPITGNYLLSSGYALAGSSYATTGWAVQQAIPDQIKVLDRFASLVGTPKRTIAWGHSLGGMVTAGLIQRYQKRFDAALPMCGVLGGSVGSWNNGLDSAFAFYELLGKGSGIQLVNIKNPNENVTKAEELLTKAQNTPQGRARIALAAAFADVPGWFDPLSKQPGTKDYASQENNQFDWLSQIDFPFEFDFRAEMEGRAGGNPSWNNGVDYQKLLQASVDYAEVQALYEKAGLDLNADLKTLQTAKQIEADPSALKYLADDIIYNGEIIFPVLTMHTQGDGLVSVEDESAYKDVVDEVGAGRWLRQLFIHRAGHCEFSPAETIVAFTALIYRLDNGAWPDLSPSVLNAEAEKLGAHYNVILVDNQKVKVAPEYFKFTPGRFLRPYDRWDH